MPFQIYFPHYLPSPSNHLPLTLISLEEWVLITLHGVDTVKYLQGQLTCNVISLNKDHFSFAAHCNTKGKMLSNLCIFHYGKGMAYIERCSVHHYQLTELKKYAVFSKLTITHDKQVILLGLAGFQAQTALSKLFNGNVPNSSYPVMRYQDTTILYFHLPAPRFLLITTQMTSKFLQQKMKGQAQLNNSQQWLALDIEAGYPIIDKVNSIKFIPQAVNLQALGGISFNKGCYIGQEIVARTKYRGTNKHSMYWLSGTASYIPAAGDNLELKIKKQWRKTGTVLAACKLKTGNFWIQAILNNKLTMDSLLRICEDSTSLLTISPLPYIH